MPDFKLGNIIISDAKLGASQVSSIYYGTFLIWPIDTTRPSDVTGFTANNIAQTNAALYWDEATDNAGVVGYEIYNSSNVLIDTVTILQKSLVGLTAGTSYTYRIKAKDAVGNLSLNFTSITFSTQAEAVTTDTIAPTIPVLNSVVGSQTLNRITVSWSASTDNLGHPILYMVYRNQNGGAYSYLNGGDFLTYVDTSAEITSNITYGYKIRAFEQPEQNTSAYSNAITLYYTDSTVPSTPTSLNTSLITSSSMTLGWTASTDNVAVTGYNIYNNGSFVKAVGVVTSSSMTGLSSNTSHSWTVRAFDAKNNLSGISTANVASTLVATDITRPSDVTGLTAIGTYETSIALDWNNASDNIAVAGYKIYNSAGTLLLDTESSNSFGTVSGLSSGTSYSFKVKAYDAAGNESLNFSNTYTRVTVTATPSLTYVSSTSSSITLSWLPVSGASSYTIQYGAPNAVNPVTLVTSPHTQSSLIANTSYGFTIRALNSEGTLSGVSTQLNQSTSAVADITAPTVPGGITFGTPTLTTYVVNWGASTDAVGPVTYNVYRNGVELVASQSGLSYSHTDTTGQSDTWKIRAKDGANNYSVFNTELSNATLTAAPVLTVGTITSTSIAMSWPAITGASSYKLYWKITGGTYASISSVTSAYTKTGLTASSQYNFYLVSINASGFESAVSNTLINSTIAADITAPSTPQNVRFYSDTGAYQ